MIFAGRTDVGLKRSNNEDAFTINQDFGIGAVADGMGGAAAGEIASKFFVSAALEIFEANIGRSEEEMAQRVKMAFSLANEKILGHVEQNPAHKGMGCTAELLAFHEDGFVLGHIGDSRTYLLRNGMLKQLSQDHTLVQAQLAEGLIKTDNIKNHPLRNVILRAVGLEQELELDLLKGKTVPGDLFLLCSDGLTDMLHDDQIREILNSDRDIDRKSQELIETAKIEGGKDNITVVLAEVPGR